MPIRPRSVRSYLAPAFSVLLALPLAARSEWTQLPAPGFMHYHHELPAVFRTVVESRGVLVTARDSRVVSRSMDWAKSWTNVPNPGGVETFLARRDGTILGWGVSEFETNPSHALWGSRDQGLSWQPVSTDLPWLRRPGTRLFDTDSALYAVAQFAVSGADTLKSDLLRSEDGGRTWTSLVSGFAPLVQGTFRRILGAAFSGDRIVVLADDNKRPVGMDIVDDPNLLYSADEGRTWSDLSDAIAPLYPWRKADLVEFRGRFLLSSSDFGEFQHYWIDPVAGTASRVATPSAAGHLAKSLAGDLLFRPGWGYDTLFASPDGAAWTRVDPDSTLSYKLDGSDWCDVRQGDSAIRFTPASIHATTDGGRTWTASVMGIASTLLFDHLETDSAIVGSDGEGGNIVVSRDAGRSWTGVLVPVSWKRHVFGALGGTLLATSLSEGNPLNWRILEMSNDGGASWSHRGSETLFDDLAVRGRRIFGRRDAASVFPGLGMVVVSSDTGLAWSPLFVDAKRHMVARRVVGVGSRLIALGDSVQFLVEANGDTVVVGDLMKEPLPNTLYESTDQGATWSPARLPAAPGPGLVPVAIAATRTELVALFDQAQAGRLGDQASLWFCTPGASPVWSRSRLQPPPSPAAGPYSLHLHGDRIFYRDTRGDWVGSLDQALTAGLPIDRPGTRQPVRPALRGHILTIPGAGERLDLHDVRGARIVAGLSGRANADGCSWDLGALPAGRYVARTLVDGEMRTVPVLYMGR